MSFKLQRGVDATVTKTFRLPSELAQQLEDIALNYKLSVNACVVQCLEYAISQLEEEPETETETKN